MRRRFAVRLLGISLVVAACATDEDGRSGGPADAQALDPVFDNVCRGLTLRPATVLPSQGPGQWGGVEPPQVAAQQPFLLALSSGRFEGYLALPNNRAGQIPGEITTGLVKDVDFSTDCDVTGDAKLTNLLPMTIYAAADLSGTPCQVPIGTRFPDHGFSRSGGQAAMFSSTVLTKLCGFEKGYSSDLVYALLLLK